MIASLHEAVADYKTRGWQVVKVKTRGKEPEESRWPSKDPNAENFGATNNVGVKLGPKSGNLIDLDLDWPEARQMAALPELFGGLPSFGRAGLPYPGHRLLVCPELLSENAKVYQCAPHKSKSANEGKLCVMEVRASSTHMTVFPPSEHAAKIVWSNGQAPENIPSMAWSEVVKRAWLTAFMAIALRNYPGEGGRDDYVLKIGGALAHYKVDPELGAALLYGLCEAAGDTGELDMRVGKCRQAWDRMDAGEATVGIQRLLDEEHFTQDEGKALRLFLKPPGKSDKVSTDSVYVSDPDLSNFFRVLQARIMAANPNLIFRRGGDLVHVRVLDEDELEHNNQVLVRRGSVTIAPAREAWMSLAASSAGIQFHKTNSMGKIRNCRPDGLSVLLSAPEETSFLRLAGVSTTPTMERNTPGYDPATHMMLVFRDGYYPEVDMRPTKALATAALDRIKWPLRKFPFAGAGDQSVMLSAIISAVIRDELMTCPMHIFDAPLAGTGKSMCADIVSLIATGILANSITYTANVEEMEKRLFAMLMRGSRIINLDNVSTPLGGDFLCSMLTSPQMEGRPLGKSEIVTLNTNALVMATGNNMVIRGDMVRRTVTCRLDAKCEAPDKRAFDFDPIADVTRARAQMVMDAITVIRAYRVAGQPDKPGHLGNFTAWTQIRGALMWLGEDDPVVTQNENRDSDPDAEARAEILGAIWDWMEGGTSTFTIGDLEGARGDRVREVLARYLPKGIWSNSAVGWLLRRHRGIPCGQFTLHSKSENKRRNYWIEMSLVQGEMGV